MERAIFFDLDGTLFDTRADLAETVNRTRLELGLTALPQADVLACVGHGARYLLAEAILNEWAAKTGVAASFDEVWTLFRAHYADCCCLTVQPYPGVLATLEELRRRGWKVGVNTNKPNFATHAIFKKFGLTDFFGSAIVAGGDGIALKPDPASIRACAARLDHLLTSEDWMVGDSAADMNCATNAGVKGAFCLFGFGSLEEAQATIKISSFPELLDLE